MSGDRAILGRLMNMTNLKVADMVNLPVRQLHVEPSDVAIMNINMRP